MVRQRLWARFAADATDAIDGWGMPMSRRVRGAVLAVTLAVWVVVVGFYLLRNSLPDAKVLGIPIGVLIALRPGKRKADEDDEDEGGD